MSGRLDPESPHIATLAERYRFSEDAVRHMRAAIAQGWGSMAAFDHPEFGGPGQWMRGGLLMLSDALNYELKARVDGLCNALATRFTAEGETRAPDTWASTPSWWPAELGTPTATGQQNDLEYACFAQARRLAVRDGGEVTVHDSGDHRIQGVAQQQTGGRSAVTFTSQHGAVELDRLPVVSRRAGSAGETAAVAAVATAADDVFDAIERLADLYHRGLLTDAEYTAKKQALLARI